MSGIIFQMLRRGMGAKLQPALALQVWQGKWHIRPIAFLGIFIFECRMHAQNTVCGQSTKNVCGFDLNGIEKYTFNISSSKIEAAMPHN
jgi:hypothetical protein